jgi:integrase/recombinase XerD
LAGLAESSQLQALATVKSLLAFAHKIGYIRFNVGTAALPKAKNTLAEWILHESEVHRIFALSTYSGHKLDTKLGASTLRSSSAEPAEAEEYQVDRLN